MRYDLDNDTYVTVAASLSHGSNPNSNMAGRRNGHAVRRLTPIECERLQALPDNWTNPDGTAPDSRRYAALGDAVTATVGHWLGRRLAEAGT